MKPNKRTYAALPLSFALALAACGDGDKAAHPPVEEKGATDAKRVEGTIVMSAEQIGLAGIQIGHPMIGGSGTFELPATIDTDPQGMQVVSAAIGGRVVSLTRNLGQSVGQGQAIAVIESREAASLNAEIEAARARLSLAKSNLDREQRLFAQKVSPEQDLIAARTAATEARIALRLAQQQVSAAGTGGGALNRIAILSPISGQIIARSVVLGQTVTADAELFRVANLSSVSLSLNVLPQDAGHVHPGNPVTVKAAGRETTARVTFVSPALDTATRLVPVIAMLDNRAGQWRVGEPVTASIALSSSGDGDNGDGAVKVPTTAVQTDEGRTVIFVRTQTGFKAVPVILGDSAGDMVIVKSGLKGTEKIATVNSFTLKAELGKSEAVED
ncbi:efflux RND transporter periplasmic adaptor subunit [Novosphingobium sp. fls2-241-R2A-195]|jgi:cobalt-zinc-cadmium efflux system membrane fusion protein|uniref:efflux RND transporter periplasmic adaptor subunit n=1 Tax=Novosphingobium sp. fls2-241-R2A-195 TaxID=3040296 RepID=UPI002550D359|nr:efflux RND transporter periplasmic adaptor subunit [Novosphingobium sp. fls2-241-R2A-195]